MLPQILFAFACMHGCINVWAVGKTKKLKQNFERLYLTNGNDFYEFDQMWLYGLPYLL